MTRRKLVKDIRPMRLDAEKIYGVIDVARMLHVHPQTIYSKISNGEALPKKYKVGNRVIFKGSDILEFIDSQPSC